MKNDQVVEFTSLQNPRIKQLVKLRDRSERDKTNQFLIEGYRELLRAVESSYPIEALFICRNLFLGSNEETLIAKLTDKGTKIFSCNDAVFRKISYRDRPDGLLGLAPQRHDTLLNLKQKIQSKSNPFLVVAEAVEKPGNLGTILRSSDAVGLDGLIVCDKCTDLYNPNVVRASVGTLFSVPVVEASGRETIQWLKQNNIAIVAATPSAKIEFTEADLSGAIAIAVGTEQLGLSDLWMNGADIQVRIPMLGIADSLNVAMATTLLLYEAQRQRKEKNAMTTYPFKVLYDDNHLLVINKNCGLLTQPTDLENTSVEVLAKEWLKEKYHKPGNVFLGIVHRLDKPVSGIVLLAKTSKALSRINEAIRQKAIKKTYLALIEGNLPKEEGTLENFLRHDDYKAYVTHKNDPQSKLARPTLQNNKKIRWSNPYRS